MTLYILPHNDTVKRLVENQIQNHRWTDSGFDIPLLSKNIDMSEKVHCFSLGISVAATFTDKTTAPCLLLPRSSIYKTPFRLCNSIGLIDAGYRGELIARVDCLDPNIQNYTITEGRRLFQIVQHNWLPFNEVIIVDSVADLPAPPDNRGGGGFGSTGN